MNNSGAVMKIENMAKLSALISGMALMPEYVTKNERKMIYESVTQNRQWWLEYYYHEQLGLLFSDCYRYEEIKFCSNLLVLLGDMKSWTVECGIPFSFPGYDNNTVDEDEIIHVDIIDLLLKYNSERYASLNISSCPSSPGVFIDKYRDLVSFYLEITGNIYNRAKPSSKDLLAMVRIINPWVS